MSAEDNYSCDAYLSLVYLAMEGLGTFQNAFVCESLPSIGWWNMVSTSDWITNRYSFSALAFAILRIGGFQCRSYKIYEVASIVVAFIIFFVGANYLMEVNVDKFPNLGRKGQWENGFSNTFYKYSCWEHAHLLNTADFNSAKNLQNEAGLLISDLKEQWSVPLPQPSST